MVVRKTGVLGDGPDRVSRPLLGCDRLVGAEVSNHQDAQAVKVLDLLLEPAVLAAVSLAV